jgi:hypothetical protein
LHKVGLKREVVAKILELKLKEIGALAKVLLGDERHGRQEACRSQRNQPGPQSVLTYQILGLRCGVFIADLLLCHPSSSQTPDVGGTPTA